MLFDLFICKSIGELAAHAFKTLQRFIPALYAKSFKINAHVFSAFVTVYLLAYITDLRYHPTEFFYTLIPFFSGDSRSLKHALYITYTLLFRFGISFFSQLSFGSVALHHIVSLNIYRIGIASAKRKSQQESGIHAAAEFFNGSFFFFPALYNSGRLLCIIKITLGNIFSARISLFSLCVLLENYPIYSGLKISIFPFTAGTVHLLQQIPALFRKHYSFRFDTLNIGFRILPYPL